MGRKAVGTARHVHINRYQGWTIIILRTIYRRICVVYSIWDLLDSCSTVSVFKSDEYVTSIRDSKKTLTVMTNGGTQKSTKIADTRFFEQVCFNPESMANIFSLADLCKYTQVTMDSSVKNTMYVHCKDRLLIEFKE